MLVDFVKVLIPQFRKQYETAARTQFDSGLWHKQTVCMHELIYIQKKQEQKNSNVITSMLNINTRQWSRGTTSFVIM